MNVRSNPASKQETGKQPAQWACDITFYFKCHYAIIAPFM